MKIIAIYDNPRVADRFTVVLNERRRSAGKWLYTYLGVNECPTDPSYGFSQCGECVLGRHLGKKIKFEDLPEKTQKHVQERLS